MGVTPYRFYNKNNINGQRIKIVCYDDENNKIENNSSCHIHKNLLFKVINDIGSLLSSSDSIIVIWKFVVQDMEKILRIMRFTKKIKMSQKIAFYLRES